jgi:phosphohistidine phosphatase
MKRLTLVRHAQAESAVGGQTDFDRALTRRGCEDASEMARRLKFRKLHVEHIISSTAPRAFATAEVFARALRLTGERVERDDRLYTAGPNEYLIVVREAAERFGHLLISAHNPCITEFADKLSSERRIDSMPTCATVTLRFAVDSWRKIDWQIGLDVELDYPGRSP